METKNLVAAIAISIGIMIVWQQFIAPPPPQPAMQQQQPGTTSTGAAAPAVTPSPGVITATATTPAPTSGAGRPAEEKVTLETPDARFVLSSYGGTLRQIQLMEKKFRDVALVTTDTVDRAPLRTTFPKADFQLPDDVAWAMSQPAKDTVVFRAETDQVVVEKRYKAQPQRYRLHLEVVVENKTDKALGQSLAVHLFAKQDPKKKGGGFLDYASANVTDMVCYVGDEAHRNSIETLHKEPKDYLGNVQWMAVDEKFFTIAAVAAADTAGERKCGQRALDEATGETFLSFASRTVPAHGSTTYEIEVYGGPKDTTLLAAVGANLEGVVNVTFAVLSRPLLFLLKFFHGFAQNWGLAIILLTIFVKLVTFYPTHRTMMSAKKMQKLAPKLTQLRTKYGEDRQRMGTETMNLYKSHGVSPFGGCLPSLIQMPIWIALFSTLNYAVELHRAPFLGYIHDLSARDPFYITPLLMGGVMYLQMRMSPAGADPQQQKMMAIMMPIMFTAFSLFLPAGLAVYTLTSYLIGILQQLLVNHLDRRGSLQLQTK